MSDNQKYGDPVAVCGRCGDWAEVILNEDDEQVSGCCDVAIVGEVME